MADREDIDALLIGALYGELDEADRARLAAHLASHPQDRMALEAMKSTRGLLRDAEVAAAMVEPPAAVSALLLQEAARRAPAARTAGSSGGLLGFLAGLLRPVMAHPALSAAATLVVIGGAAGALYLRGAAKTVQPDEANRAALAHSGASAGSAASAETTSPAAAGPAAPSFGRNQDFTGSEQEQAATSGRGRGDDAVAGLKLDPSAAPQLDNLARVDSVTTDGYRVSLADGKPGAAVTKEEAQRELALATRAAERKDVAPTVGTVQGFAQDKDQAAKGVAGQAAEGDRTTFLEVGGDRDEPALRAMDDTVAGEASLAEGRLKQKNDGQLTQSLAVAPAPPPTALSPDLKLPAGVAGGSPRPTAPGSKPSAITTGGTGSGALGATTAADPSLIAPYDAGSDAATLTWAREQHARLVKMVAAGKCNEAGVLGASVQRKAPDYYQDHVYNDRRIRACRPYVDKARRAAEPARKRDAPSPATDELAAPDRANN